MEHTEQNKTPLDLIQQEVEKAKRAPKKVGLLSVKPANDWIVDSLNSPDPKTFFHDLIVQYENTVIFAASNVGKSILAIQIAEHIARTEKILYIDLELSSKQFQMRYTDTSTGEVHIFPSNFIRAEIDPELIMGADLEQEILDSIEEAALQGISYFVVDNLTFICNDSEKGAIANAELHYIALTLIEIENLKSNEKIYSHCSFHDYLQFTKGGTDEKEICCYYLLILDCSKDAVFKIQICIKSIHPLFVYAPNTDGSIDIVWLSPGFDTLFCIPSNPNVTFDYIFRCIFSILMS